MIHSQAVKQPNNYLDKVLDLDVVINWVVVLGSVVVDWVVVLGLVVVVDWVVVLGSVVVVAIDKL